MSSAVRGAGTQLQRETTPGSGTWTTIAEVRSIDGPNSQIDQDEVTNLDSTAREYIAGLRDNGSLSFPYNWFADASHDQLEDDADSGITRNYRIRFPQFSPVQLRTFQAFVQSIGGSVEPGTAMQKNVTLQISGSVTRSTE